MPKENGIHAVMCKHVFRTCQRRTADAFMAVRNADADVAEFENSLVAVPANQVARIVISRDGLERCDRFKPWNGDRIYDVAAVHDNIDAFPRKARTQRGRQRFSETRHVRVGNDANDDRAHGLLYVGNQ